MKNGQLLACTIPTDPVYLLIYLFISLSFTDGIKQNLVTCLQGDYDK